MENKKDELFSLLDELKRTRTTNSSKKVIKKINKLVKPILRQFCEIQIKHKTCLYDDLCDMASVKSLLNTDSGEVEWYQYEPDVDALAIDFYYVCFSESFHETLYIPIIAFENMELLEERVIFKKSLNLSKNIKNNALKLECDVDTWNEDDDGIEYLKTYDVLYLDPIDDKYKIVQAWPAYSEDKNFIPHTVWTLCDSDVVLANARIAFKIKHYEKDKQKENHTSGLYQSN
jgi:hypothetical protein